MRKRALVVGLGIAGMSAAIGLRRAGWTPVIVERAPERRTGGYFVGLFPEGRQAAVDLGIADHLHTRNPEGGADAKAWSVDRRGRRRPALGFLDQPGGPAAVLRGDIEAALWQSITGVEVWFGTAPVAITEGPAEVQVLFENAGTGARYSESFDLVVGADGMRSSVRRTVFGPDEDYLANWKAMICAFQLKEQVPTYEASDSIIIARAKRAVWVFGLADHAPTALLTYRTRDIQEQFSGSRIERLRAVFSGMDDDPVVRHVLDSLEEAPDHVFDSVHQVRMPRWSKGRVVLVGDAAWCMNLYSGMGATSSLRGGAALGAALREHPDDLAAALDAWEAGLRPFITKHQRTARLKQQMFVPSSRRAEALRSVLVGLARRIRGRRPATEAGGPQAMALSGTSR
ncbi:FAD-dependent monooxygenase [Streptomyces olivaceus]|uniref:FAD-dependent monooxygenase n=1 Tax=Streptomyces olivaceus TaxID=47716 RepID=A0ABS7W4L9_STROV|nr:FAD-dependent monooxygenase [Streptomyces olivaceus]AOW89529.1 oxidoreductase [Streptomyces olivaceus]MBZ6092450.1 FAD-dependent monooxygenase [Streptomyces olivaceus]MBZ6098732.1 FAD-dependent monooxygenase [Streptomyces olivaceus]MBZ6100841.1 FAD-dependent monooxygenase [Streptomyces olivaceus]MBZ6120916.1 FAD-dependent monooxygenase [Streptomyces olivaceus]